MKKSKLLALLLSVCTLATALVGCGEKDNDKDKDKPSTQGESVEQGEDNEGPKEATISILYDDNATYPLNEKWDVLNWIKEETGISFDINAVPESDYLTKVPVILNSGDIPDIVMKNFPKGTDILSGVYLPISDYEDQMPNYVKFIEDNGLREVLDGQRMSDGKYYMIPMKIHTSAIQDQQWLIRTDIFEKHDIPVPTTLDQMYEAGKKLKELYPDSTPITNRFGSGNIMTGFAAAFGTVAGWTYGDGMLYDYDTKTWGFSATSDSWKEMLDYTNKLYAEGILDQEFSTLDSTVYEQKIMNGQTFMMYDWAGNIKRYTDTVIETNPEFHLSPIVPPQGPDGDYAVCWKAPWAQACTFPARLADEPEQLEAVLRLIDWGYTDDAEILLTFGKEGETYEINNETGRINYKGADEENPINYYASSGLDNNCFTFREHEDFLYGLFEQDAIDAFVKIAELDCVPNINPTSPLTAEQNDGVAEYLGNLNDYINTSMEKFIFGQMTIENDWDEFVSQCNKKGAEKLQAAYDEATK